MMTNMLAGQYIPGSSMLHTLAAGIKVICLCMLAIAVVVTSTIHGYAAMLIGLGVIVGLSRLSPRAVLAPIARIRFFFAIIFLMNALFYSSDQPLLAWGIISITQTGIKQGATVVFNVAYIMALANVLTCTTTPIDLTTGLAGLLKPLRFLRVPVEDVAMIIGIAVRFIPTLLEEAEMIKKAQTARGAKFESKKFRERASSFLQLLIPVFLAAFRRADELSVAMEARGYRNARNRTPKATSPLKSQDLVALGGCVSIFLVQIYF